MTTTRWVTYRYGNAVVSHYLPPFFSFDYERGQVVPLEHSFDLLAAPQLGMITYKPKVPYEIYD